MIIWSIWVRLGWQTTCRINNHWCWRMQHPHFHYLQQRRFTLLIGKFLCTSERNGTTNVKGGLCILFKYYQSSADIINWLKPFKGQKNRKEANFFKPGRIILPMSIKPIKWMMISTFKTFQAWYQMYSPHHLCYFLFPWSDPSDCSTTCNMPWCWYQ